MNRQSRFPIYETGYLKNAGSFAMNVNGSSVAKDFQFAPSVGIWTVSRIGVMLIIIRAASGDYLKAIVQDDLTGLETFRMMYKAFRETQ